MLPEGPPRSTHIGFKVVSSQRFNSAWGTHTAKYNVKVSLCKIPIHLHNLSNMKVK